jgi:hypothetical protein
VGTDLRPNLLAQEIGAQNPPFLTKGKRRKEKLERLSSKKKKGREEA